MSAKSPKVYASNGPEFLAAQNQFLAEAEGKGFTIRTLRLPTEPTVAPWASRLFRMRPKQWGLRGDPWLWREARETLGLVEWPESAERFEEALRLALAALVGVEFNVFSTEQVPITRYPLAGMSGGLVCPPKWVDDLIPMLVNRFEEALEHGSP